MGKLRQLINKYKQKYLNIPIQARASLWFLICSVMISGLNIITLPIFTRLLTTEQYGLSSTYFAWNELAVILCTLRFSYGVFDKGMVIYQDRRDFFESTLLGLSMTITIINCLIVFLLGKQIAKIISLPYEMCLSLCLFQIVSPGVLFWTDRSKFEYKYKSFTIFTLLFSISCTIINLCAVIILPYDKALTKIYSYQIAWGIANLFICLRIFIKGKHFYNFEVWKYALKYNIPLIPYFLSTIILDKSDRIMIGNYCGQSNVAIYSVSYNIGNLMIIFTTAIGGTFTPWIYQKLKTKCLDSVKTVTSLIILGYMILSFIFLLFAPEIIRLFASKDYYQAVYVVPPLIASNFFILLYSLVSKIEYYYDHTKAIAIITVLAAILNVILNYLAIPKFGYISAAYTTLICYMMSTIGHSIITLYICKKEGISISIYPWKSFVIFSIIIIIITILVSATYTINWLRYSLILISFFFICIFRKKIIFKIKNLYKD